MSETREEKIDAEIWHDRHYDGIMDILTARKVSAPPDAMAISATTLSRRLGITEREVRTIISDLRRQLTGETIISGQNGYWLSSDAGEIQVCANRLIQHGTEEIKAGKAMLLCLEKGAPFLELTEKQ